MHTKSNGPRNEVENSSQVVNFNTSAGAINLDDIIVEEAKEFELVWQRLPMFYRQIPLGQAPAIAKLTNVGSGDLTDVNITATWNGATVDAVGGPVSLASGQSTIVRFDLPAANSTLANIGATSNEITTAVTLSGTNALNVNSGLLYATDALTSFSTFGTGRTSENQFVFGVLYDITMQDKLGSIEVGIPAAVAATDSVVIRVIQLDENRWFKETVHEQSFLGPHSAGLNVFELPTPMVLEPGTYFVQIVRGFVSSSGNTSDYFYMKHPSENRLVSVNAHALADMDLYGSELGSLAIRMRMYQDIDECIGAEDLTADATMTSAFFNWTPSSIAPSQILQFDNGSTIQSFTYGGTEAAQSFRDVLMPSGTDYKYRIIAVCNSRMLDTTDWVTFNAKPYTATPTVTLTYANIRVGGNAYVRYFDQEEIYCWEQEFPKKSEAGQDIRWVRVNNVQAYGGGPLNGNKATRLMAGFASTSIGSRDTGIISTHAAANYVDNSYAKGAVTKLISPVFDLSAITDNPVRLSVFHNIPRHAQDPPIPSQVMLTRRDTLAVYYRMGADKPWNFLALTTEGTVNSNPADFERLNITLPEVGSTMQFAFEARMKSDEVGTGGGVFLERFLLDTLPAKFELASVTPKDGDTLNLNAMAANRPVRAVFNQGIAVGDQEAFDKISIKDAAGNEHKSGVTINDVNLNLAYTQLWDTTEYTVTIPAGAIRDMDEEIKWSFETNTLFPSTAAPGAFNPAPVTPYDTVIDDLRTTNVVIRVTIEGNVVRAVDDDSFDKIEIWKVDSASKERIKQVEGVTAALEGKVLTIRHGGLDLRSMYEVDIPVDVIHNHPDPLGVRPWYKGGSGGEAVQPGPWYFYTTHIRLDLVAANYVYLPARDAQNVELNAGVSVTFNLPIAYVGPASLEAVTIRKTTGSVLVEGTTATIEGSTITIAHGGLEEGTQYTVTIPANLVGNAAPVTWNFTTKGGTSINPELLEANTVLIYPNPAKDVIYVKSKYAVKRIEFFNLQGQLIKRADADLQEINVSDLAVGTYLVRITTDKGFTTHQIVKQ
jgi:hypothetical protein